MYSELFRILGWIHSAQDGRQEFTFTFLGAHIALDQGIPDDLIKECLLRISYPNPHVEVKGDHRVRPIATILLMARELDGRISRDEIILGPLQLKDDQDKKEVAKSIAHIRRLRKDSEVDNAVNKFADDIGIQLNTLQNYTRFPLGLLRWAGWAIPSREGRGVEYVLTSAGIAIADRVRSATDIRNDNLTGVSEGQVIAFIKLAFYQMMVLAGFSVEGIEDSTTSLTTTCGPLLARLKIRDSKGILFSPFQECDPVLLAKAFPQQSKPSTRSPGIEKGASNTATPMPRPTLTARVKLTASTSKSGTNDSSIATMIRTIGQKKDLLKTVDAVFDSFQSAGKHTFYPAVADLFKCLDFDCNCSRVGVNYQRMDALICDERDSVPIEIKSPGEEEFLSVKGVRQALENKIVLMSRHYAPSTASTTSLAVGYHPPNNRSEVSSLISDIYSTYKISIGVIDFRSLIHLAATRILCGRTLTRDTIFHLRGILEIENS